VKARPLFDTLRAFCAALALAATAHAAPVVVYDNTSVDLQWSVFFSTGYTQLGDQVQLAAPTTLSSLDTQFFNAGEDAVFNATLSLYAAGGPVPTLLGSAFTVTDLSIAAGSSLTVTFADLGALAVPADVLVLFSVDLVSGNGDIGLNFFEAPTVGSSELSFFYADDGSGLAQASTLMDMDNLYLQITGTPQHAVPEPASAWLVLLPLGALVWRQRQAGQRHAEAHGAP
jgi:hypothetical protein